MNSKQYRIVLVVTWISLLGVAQIQAAEETMAQTVAPAVSMQVAGTAGNVPTEVTINVIDTSLNAVLDLFAQQTQKNVVIGPDVGVVSNGVTLHLTHVQWSEALDVILKPYGFGYQKVGNTIVVSRLDKLAALAAVEMLETKVFNLKYLDASDVQDIIKGQLSPRGTSSVAVSRGMKGWQTTQTSGSGSGQAASSLGQLARVEDYSDKNERVRSKTLIVTDVPNSLARVSEVLAKLDILPQQVLVETRFMEVNQGLLKDIGLDASYSDGEYSIGQLFSTVAPGVFDPTASGFWPASLTPMNQNSFLTRNGSKLDVAIRAIQEDKDTKVLSAPRILTLNNQEATIVVGQKYPIIESQVSGSGGNSTVSTTLRYYENIGIQLNVVPQICDDEQINMIVHPSVSSIEGLKSGKVNTGASDNATALTEYPLLNIREAETQILLNNGETAIIGGLLEDRKGITQSKVPLLGDIPVIGRLFRRDITDNRTIDLLIFLKATIVTPENRNTVIGESGKSGTPMPVTITVPPAAIEVPPAAVVEQPVAVVKMSE
jgi:type IV pilus assembly protein PilQ